MVAALLNNIPTPWAVALAGYIGAVTYQLSTFCTTDPPAVPTITAVDVLDLLNVYNPVTNPAAGAKFQQLIGAYLWYQVCECTSVTTPAPPAAPAAPTGMPAINPPIVAPPTSSTCLSVESTFSRDELPSYTPSAGLTWEWGGQLLTAADGSFTEVVGGGARQSWLIPPTTTAYTIRVTTHSGGPATQQPWLLVKIRTAAGAVQISPVEYVPPDGQTYTMRRVLPGTLGYSMYASWNGGGTTPVPNVTISMDFECQGGAQFDTPCCPPDPLLQTQLDRILGMVTLIQRQLAPFAYVSGAVHSGLTGNGSIAVQGLIGAQLHVTAFGAEVSELDGDPDVLFSAGWVNWGSADGVTPREFLTAAEQVSFPAAAGAMTEIHYSLGVGVALEITELEREP